VVVKGEKFTAVLVFQPGTVRENDPLHSRLKHADGEAISLRGLTLKHCSEAVCTAAEKSGVDMSTEIQPKKYG